MRSIDFSINKDILISADEITDYEELTPSLNTNFDKSGRGLQRLLTVKCTLK